MKKPKEPHLLNLEIKEATVVRVKELGEHYVCFYIEIKYDRVIKGVLKYGSIDISLDIKDKKRRWSLKHSGILQNKKDVEEYTSKYNFVYQAKNLVDTIRMIDLATESKIIKLDSIYWPKGLPVRCKDFGLADEALGVAMEVNSKNKFDKKYVRALAMVDLYRARKRTDEHKDADLFLREGGYIEQFLFRMDPIRLIDKN